MSTEVEVFDAELVEGDIVVRPTAAEQGPRYLVTQHTMLGPGELPPLADERPAWTDDDFRLSVEDMVELAEPNLRRTRSRTATRRSPPSRRGARRRSRRGWPTRARPRPTPRTACT